MSPVWFRRRPCRQYWARALGPTPASPRFSSPVPALVPVSFCHSSVDEFGKLAYEDANRDTHYKHKKRFGRAGGIFQKMEKGGAMVKRILLVIALGSGLVFGQGFSAAISGVVRDTSGAVVPGVNITVKHV